MTAIAAATGIRRSAEGRMSDTQILARALRLVSREMGLPDSAMAPQWIRVDSPGKCWAGAHSPATLPT